MVIATTYEAGSDVICEIAEKHQTHWYQGSTDDVLERFYQAALPFDPDWVVRVTSDCPLIDPKLIDQVIKEAMTHGVDYCTNVLVEDFPDGQDVEVFKMSALERAWKEAEKPSEREHVTPFIRNNSDAKGGDLFTAWDVTAPDNYNSVRMTVDEPADLEMMDWLVREYGIEKDWITYAKVILENQDLLTNKDILRNEGYIKSIKEEQSWVRDKNYTKRPRH